MKKLYLIMAMVTVLLPLFLSAQRAERYGVITTRQKTDSARTCTKDGVADIVYFWPPTFAFQTGLVITDTNDIIQRYNVRSRYNFEGEEPGICRVYGITYIGLFEPLTIGKHIDSARVMGQLVGITNNYVTITKVFTQAGEITTIDDSHEAFICLGDNRPKVVEVKSSGSSQEPYVFALTNEAGTIIQLFEQPTINFDTASGSIYYIHGISYSGDLMDAVGQPIEGFIASTECYQVSTSRITVHTVKGEDIKPVVINASEDSLFICTGDSLENLVPVTLSAESFPGSGYIVTDSDGKILATNAQDTFDFASFKSKTIHIYAIGYYGQINAVIGEQITTANLASQCYELSFNYIVVQSLPVTNSTVIASSPSPVSYCAGDGTPDFLVLSNSLQGGSDYLYVISDTSGKIISVQQSDSLDLESIVENVARISGVSYNGQPNEVNGQSLNEAVFTDDCFVLSDNYIEVVKAQVDGGEISVTTGNNICVKPNSSTTYEIHNTSGSTQPYYYIVQDLAGHVLAISDTSITITSDWSADSIIIRGVSVFGELEVNVGDSINTEDLTGCLAFSSNTLVIDLTYLGDNPIQLNGVDTLSVCINDNKDEQLILSNTHLDGEYVYAFLDASAKVIKLESKDTLTDEELPEDIAYIVGINYAQNLPVAIGDQLDDFACAVLSTNRVVILPTSLTDFSFTSDRGDTLYFCASTSILDSVQFQFLSSGEGQNQRLILVDQAGEVLAVSDEEGQFNYSGSGATNLKIRGIAYTGELGLDVGENIDSTELSTGCYKIVDEVIELFIGDPSLVEGGTVSSDKGETLDICTSDGQADVVIMSKATGSTANYSYVVTSSDGVILSVSSNAAINFEGSGGGTVHIYGLSHTNPLPMILGSSITSVLPIGCYNTSINFITVNRTDLNEFDLREVGNSSEQVFICRESSFTDSIFTEIVGEKGAKYGLILSAANGTIVLIDSSSTIALNDSLQGTYNLWGFKYSGMIIAKVGDNLTTTPLASLCYNRSRGPLQVNISEINGGEVGLDGTSSGEVCYGNGYPDDIKFSTTGTGSYAYLITDEDDNFLASTTNDHFDFEGLNTPNNYRVYGMSYTGSILLNPGDNILDIENLTAGCHMLSSNFIALTKGTIMVGNVFIEGEETPVIICSDTLENFIHFDHQTSSGEHYAYIVASPDERIVGVFDTNAIDFNAFPAGLCLVYGLAYDGELRTVNGQLINQAIFASGCFGVTSTFVEIIKSVPDGGLVEVAEGDTIITICAGDGAEDRIIFGNNSNGLSAYQYIITDTNNTILALPPIPVYNFDDSGLGVCRVWGMAFTGNVSAEVGQNLLTTSLSSDCYDLSANYITVLKVNSGEACGAPAQEEPILRLAAYPVPVTGQLSIEVQKKKLENNPIELRIFDPYQKVWLKNSYFSPAENFTTTVNVEQLKKGMYVLEVKVGYKIEVLKFLKY